jgi:hypothetical protein
MHRMAGLVTAYAVTSGVEIGPSECVVESVQTFGGHRGTALFQLLAT